MSKKHWNEFHANFPQSINIDREDLTDFDGNQMTDESWYWFREKTMDYISDLLLEVEYKERNP